MGVNISNVKNTHMSCAVTTAMQAEVMADACADAIVYAGATASAGVDRTRKVLPLTTAATAA